MTIVAIAIVGVVVGIVAHLILGEDGYAWFGEILTGIAGAAVFGLIWGIAAGAREVNAEVVVAALIGAAALNLIVILVTFRATGRGFRQPAR